MLKYFVLAFVCAMVFKDSNAQGKVVISQVYGGGGNAGATYKNDFIELFNSGTAAVSLNGWSVQYASATGTTWTVTNLTNVSLQPGQYYLVQQAAGAGGTTNLPTPDVIGTIAMSATAFKVALVNSTTALSGSGCPFSASVIDFVGAGSTANCSETSPTPPPSNTTAIIRANGGCKDDGNNASDFTAGAPNPRNTSTALNLCPSAAATPYYPKLTATDLAQVSDWTTDPAGGPGSAPPNFTSPNQLFNLNGLINQTFNGPWIISGGSNAIISAGNLKIGPLGRLEVGTGSTFDFNGRPVNISSLSTGTGSIGVTLGSIINATNVTVERFISSNNNRAYRLLAPSVNTTASIWANWQESGNNAPGLGTHITGSTTGAGGFDITQTGNPSLFVLDATQNYVPIGNTNATNLNAKSGYLLYIRGDRTIDLNSTASPLPSNNTVLRATGTLLTGTQSFTGLTGNSGFSLITNPYASAINWASVYTEPTNTGLSQFYTLWDPNVGTEGGYVTVGATGPTAGVPSNGASNANLHIQSGQAFFIQASGSAVPVVNILEAHKSISNNRDVFRLGTHTELFTSSLFYTNGAGTRINADGVTSVYDNSYAEAVDGNDAIQIANWEEDIAIARTNYELSIESRPLIDVRDTIQFTMARLQVRSYEWQFSASGFNHPDLSASLVDNFLNTKTPINLNGTTVISFTVTSNAASSATNRFMVVFAPNNALPVNMSTVKAYQKGKDIQVEWITHSETNLDKYEVEESADARRFTKAATLPAKGLIQATTYDWLDVHVNNGSNYYRIKAISKTGEVQYSKVVRVNLGMSGYQINVYPNPVTDNTFSLNVNMPKGTYTATLTSKLGQEVYKKVILHLGGAATQTIQIERSLLPGIYQLTISNGEKNYVQQLLKN